MNSIKIDADYSISDDKSLIQIDVVHHYLSEISYWCKGIPKDIVQRSIDGSLSVGVYFKDEQVGFARLVTDFATFGYLADVFILEAHRGKGLSKAMMHFLKNHPQLKDLRRWMLLTDDAHGLYRQFGFEVAKKPEMIMAITYKDFYLNKKD